MDRAYSILDVRAVSESERVIEGIASTPTPDRVGDIVEPMGAKFSTPMPLLWQHDHDKPVGWVEFAKPTKAGIPFRARIDAGEADDPPALKDRLEEAWRSVKRRLVSAVSIGFRTLEYSVMDDGGWKFIEWEWLELSLVTIPANREATIHTVKSIDRRLRGASARGQPGDRQPPAGVAARSITQQKDMRVMKTLAEQIAAAEAARQQKASQMAQINEKAAKEGRDLDPKEQDEFDDLDADVESIDGNLRRLKRLENINADKAAPVATEVKAGNARDAAASRGGDRRTTVVGPNSAIPKGIPFARFIICLAQARGNPHIAAQLARKHFDNDPRIAKFAEFMDEKAAVPAGYTDGSGWAAEWAEANTIGSDFVEVLRPKTIVDQLIGMRQVPFNVAVPAMTGGGTGYWVGEALPVPATKGTSAKVTLGKTKVGGLTVLSRELMRFSHPSAESTVLADLVEAAVSILDSTFVSNAAAVAGVSPAGLLNGVTATGSAGDTADDVRTDIVVMHGKFSAANISLKQLAYVTTENLADALGLMRSSLGVSEFPGADGGMLNGKPLLSSNHVGGGQFIGIYPRGILLADDGDVSVDYSEHASIEMLDSTLLQDGTTGTGASTVNLWQNGLVGIKVERFINWQKGYAQAVQLINSATYQGAPTA